jgi:hypothetical protein
LDTFQGITQRVALSVSRRRLNLVLAAMIPTIAIRGPARVIAPWEARLALDAGLLKGR